MPNSFFKSDEYSPSAARWGEFLGCIATVVAVAFFAAVYCTVRYAFSLKF